jgi:DNA-binding response OmpR family regulator
LLSAITVRIHDFGHAIAAGPRSDGERMESEGKPRSVVARGRGTDAPGPSIPRRSDNSVTSSATDRARILVVEDQEDVRHMLATALAMEGHLVDEAASATEGLQCLQQSRYDLVLSDYAMPGGTGTWMLRQATEQGLLDNTISLIVTAHPDVRDFENVEVITKPLDLDKFLAQIRHILESESSAADPGAMAPEPERPAVRGPQHRVELVLYVSSASPACMEARRNFEQLLEHFDASQVSFSICDLVRDPTAGDDDRIAFTPTLVRRFPEPRMWVLGNLKEPEIIADLLRACGVDARE